MYVKLRLLKATVEFLWWVVGGVCTVIFVSNLTTVLRLRCVVVRVVTIDSRKLVVSTYKMQLDCCGGNLPPGSGKREKTRDIMGSN